jgi:hypothetical protein
VEAEAGSEGLGKGVGPSGVQAAVVEGQRQDGAVAEQLVLQQGQGAPQQCNETQTKQPQPPQPQQQGPQLGNRTQAQPQQQPQVPRVLWQTYKSSEQVPLRTRMFREQFAQLNPGLEMHLDGDEVGCWRAAGGMQEG